MYNTQADFRPKFGGKKEVHMHNMHIYFYNATEWSQASYNFISR